MQNKGKHIVKFMGGFANQLFQYCFYQRLCEQYGEDNVFVDISHYNECKDHGGFKIDRFVELNYSNLNYDNFVEIREDDFSTKDFDANTDYYYNGYWQGEEYFPDSIDFLSAIFNESQLSDYYLNIMGEIINTNSVSIHVRRGDYNNNHMHGHIATRAYYNNAISQAINDLQNPVFFVFSDDIDWCKNELKFGECKAIYVKPDREAVWNELYLMSECKGHIISNSSFSWWGQKLDSKDEKIVYCVEYWFNQIDKEDKLIDESFVKISNVPHVDKQNSNPKFSILIPAYNVEGYIRRCLASVLNQTEDDIEIIIVDDYSTDSTLQIICQYANQDKRITIIEHDENKSLLFSRIDAMKAAKGKYILLLDSDDYMDENTCKYLYDELRDRDYDIFEFSYKEEPFGNEILPSGIEISLIEDVLKINHSHTVWNKCYNSRVVKESLCQIEGFYCNMAEDSFFSLVFSNNAKTYGSTGKILYHYMLESGMSTQKSMSADRVRNSAISVKNVNEKILEYLDRYRSDLRCMGDYYTESNILFLYTLCIKDNMTLTDRLVSLRILDEILDTDFSIKYETDYEYAHNQYTKFRNAGVKGKIKICLKYLYNKIKR